MYYVKFIREHRRKRTIQERTTVLSMFLGHTNSVQAYLVAKRDQNQEHIIPQNFDFINKAIYCQRDVLRAFEAKILLNCLFRTDDFMTFGTV